MRSLKLLICFLPTLLLFSCSKEDESPVPVMIKTISVTYNNDGAIVTGEILDLGKEPIVEYGFICLPRVGEKRNVIKLIVVGTIAKTGTFRGSLTTELLNGDYWAVLAYFRTEKSFVYGNEIPLSEE